MTSKLPRLYWTLWLGTLINKAGTFVLPFLGLYLVSERGYSLMQAGIVVSVYGLGSIASGPVSGLLADRIGRRPVMVGALALGGAGMIGLGLLRSPWVILPWTLVLGFIADGYRAPVTAAIGDIIPSADRLRAYGYLYWAINVGCALSAASGGFLAARSYQWLFWLDGITTLAYAAVVAWWVPETRRGAQESHAEALSGLWSALRDPALLTFSALGLLFGMLLFQVFTTLPLDLRGRGFESDTIGLVLSVNPALVVCLQPVATLAGRRFGATSLLVASGLFFAAGAAYFAVARSAWGFALGMAIFTLGEISNAPVAPAVVAELAPAARAGRYQGVYNMAFALAAALSPALGTAVLARAGARALWIGFAIVGGILAVGHQLAAGPRLRRIEALATAEVARS